MSATAQETTALVRQDFGSTSVVPQHETAATAAAAQAKALVESKYVVALNRPRDLDMVRSKILKECARPSFAPIARFKKPVGGGKNAEGWSIRAAEAFARCMTNLDTRTPTVYEDNDQRKIEVAVTDLESNVSYSQELILKKTVERSQLKEGQEFIATRTNSYGKPVYIVPATEDEMLIKQNAHISKVTRNLILRHVPGDILDEALDQVRRTVRDADAADPDAAKKRLIDAFGSLSIGPDRLKTYLGHDLDVLTPAEIEHLRGVFNALRDGETTWAEVCEARDAAMAAKDAATTKGAAARVKDKLAQATKSEE
jgi:hypothetical protein